MKNISFKNLSQLGILDIVEKEIKKKEIIKDVPLPSNQIKLNLLKEWLISNKLKSENDLNIWLKKNELTMNELEVIVSKDWRWREWCFENFKNELESYFLKRKDNLDTILYSLIRVRDMDLANELYLKIKDDNEDFQEIARQFSEGFEKNTGGLIGPAPVDQAHPEISRLLKISSEKKLWSPIQLDKWWIILRLEKRNDAILDEKISLILSLELGEIYLENYKLMNEKHIDLN